MTIDGATAAFFPGARLPRGGAAANYDQAVELEPNNEPALRDRGPGSRGAKQARDDD